MKKWIKFVFLALYIFCVGYSLFASLQDANKSANASEGVTTAVYDVIVEVDPDTQIEYDELHVFIRKAIGHFMVFVAIGITGFCTLYFFLHDFKKALIIQAGLGLINAVISELLQLTSEGRTCNIKDMGIDYSGCLLGLLLSFITYMIIIKLGEKHEKQSN